MKWIRIVAALAAAAPVAHGAAQVAAPQAGELYEIVRSYETKQQSGDRSSGSSQGSDAWVERVVAVREDGLELEYDLHRDASAEDRARQWQLPARVLRRADGSMELLNRAELEARVQRWLEAARIPRQACGRWIFTWNAFRIDCDPASVLEVLAAVDLRSPELREGASYTDSRARGAGTLRRISGETGAPGFAAVMEISPEAVRRERAEADVALGEIMRQPVTLEEALRRRAQDRVSGTIEVRFETDAAGHARRRIKVTRVEIQGSREGSETHVRTETLERRLVSGSAARR